MKKKILLWRRFFSTTIDLSLIYALSIILQFLIWQFYYVSFQVLFVASFISYYVLFYLINNGRTPAKVLTGLQVVTKTGSKIHFKNIFLREIIFKGIFALILPLFIYERVFPVQMILILVFLYLIIIVLSLLVLLIFKINWWEYFSNILCIKSDLNSIRELKYAIYSISFTTLSTIIIIVYPFAFGNEEFESSFYPKYPIDSETKSYTEFIKNNAKNPVDYVFDLFDKYDFVVLSERMHSEYSQYDLITKIVNDKRFTTNVGNIFTECGSVSFQDTLDTYLNTQFFNEDELNKGTSILQRNSNGVWPLWDNTNLFDFLKTVNKLNSALSESQKIHWYFTDLDVNWDTMTTQGFQQNYAKPNRDSIMAAHIIKAYDKMVSKQKRKKSLVIMNFRHGYGLINEKFDKESIFPNGTTEYLMKKFQGKVANVFINTISMKYWIMLTPVQNGKWDAAFSKLGNPSAGFDFLGSPFGNDDFDAFIKTSSNLKYKDVFTGFIFYKPLEEHISKRGFPYEFDSFKSTILKRATCVDTQYVETIKALINRYNSNSNNPVFTDKVDYAYLYNLVNIIYIPGFLFFITLISFMIFLYSGKQYLLKQHSH